MRKYYAFKFLGNRNTTTGEPNRLSGRCSIAGHAMVFDSKKARDDWVNQESMGDKEVIAVTKEELRALCRGMSVQEFNLYIESSLILTQHENNR